MFIGRETELAQLKALDSATKDSAAKASLVIVYGRRRTGKTTLIEHAYTGRNLIKIEGVEGQGRDYQLKNFMESLDLQFRDPLLRNVKPENWRQAFEVLARYTTSGKWTIYLEELQWMAEYKHDLIAELKPVWDNLFQKNPNLIFVLCGSSPSYFLTHVIHSQALHNRSTLDIRLDQFPIGEIAPFLKQNSPRALFDAYLSVGGIPMYLEKLNSQSSIYLSLCEQSFTKNSFFSQEFSKVFVSSFGKNQTYRKIIEIIGKSGNCLRKDLARKLRLESGGRLSDYLVDLEECEFIKKVTPIGKTRQSTVGYYQIRDPYLHFYFKFIWPHIEAIHNGDYDHNPTALLDTKTYAQWLGFSFERFCRFHTAKIASLLGFSAVRYKVGTYFKRTNINDFGFQLDLVFDRADKVKTICEIKYKDAPVGLEVISEFEEKLKRSGIGENSQLQRVLISASGIKQSLVKQHYFDRIIGLDDLIS